MAPGPDDVDLVGKTLNRRYLVEERIGEGGFGDVYRARQIQMDREVAIKVLAPGMGQDENLVERFRREAKSACNLRDPHTIITYDFDETENGLLYIAMELLQGETLFDVMEEDTLIPPPRVAGIIEQCCTSLGEAHTMGIVHRDIKPENIFLEHRPDYPDFVKILDFGIAKIVAGDLAQGPQLTAAGQTLGTLEYMSPEQLMGKTLDGRSDIYALGILAHQMLTGTLPFSSGSPASIIQWHLKELPQPASSLVPSVPADFDPIILNMVAKDRDKRYASVSQLREDLRVLMARHGWLVGGGSGPMTAVPQAPLPAAPSAPAPMASAGGSEAATVVAVPVSVGEKKSKLPLIIVLVLLALGLVGFAVWFFALRGGGGDGESSSSSKSGMSSAAAMGTKSSAVAMRPAAMRPAAMRPVAMRPAAMRPAAMRPAAMRPAALPDAMSSSMGAARPSLGGLLGVLGSGSSGATSRKRSVGGIGALLGGGQKLPAAGKITRGRRGRAGLKASERSPLRVIPPQMTLWGRLNLAALRRTSWGRSLLAKIPAKTALSLGAMGLSLSKVRVVAMGLTFRSGAGASKEPIMMFAVSGKLKTKALLRAIKKEKGALRRTKVAGFRVLQKGDLNLVLPSDRLVIFGSKEVLRNGLARMSARRVKSAVEAGWARRMLRSLGQKEPPDLLLAMELPPALQKKAAALLKELTSSPGASIHSFMLLGKASRGGLGLTLAVGCSSASVAGKLKKLLPMLVKVLLGKLPAPLRGLAAGLTYRSRGKVVAMTLGLDRAGLNLLWSLILGAAR